MSNIISNNLKLEEAESTLFTLQPGNRESKKMMDFGEFRSKMHNGEKFTWWELEKLFKRPDYEEACLPYMLSFSESFWKDLPIKHFRHFHLLELFAKKAPFASFVYEHFQGPLDFGHDAFLQVVELDLSPCRIDSFTMQRIASSSNLQNLTYLKVSYKNDFLWRAKVGAGCKALAESPYLQNLQVLDMSDNFIGDRGAQHLVESSYLQNLTKLHLSRCGIGEEARELLRDRFGPYVVTF